MKKVITYGTYDLLHYGHIKLLERAKALGDYLIVGVTADDFDKTRGKINVQQSLMERVEAVKATGLADEIIIEEYEGQKIDDIKRLDVSVFTVGSDWQGKFDYLSEFCEVVYLDRTQGISSSDLRAEKQALKIGLIGAGNILEKYYFESSYVNGISVEGIVSDNENSKQFASVNKIKVYDTFTDMLQDVEAVYIIEKPRNLYEISKTALMTGKHVLCEAPIALSAKQIEELFSIAAYNKVVLMEAIKTAYSTAYNRLQLLIKGGKIGKIVSVDATCTSVRNFSNEANGNLFDEWNSIFAWGPTALLPIFQILGTKYEDCRIISKYADEKQKYDIFSKIDLIYKDAIATVKVGQGVKSEGDLVITGTKGYAYVPAPWWKTDYFELRYENPADNKRFFYHLDGEGIRYELVAFVKAIESGKDASYINRDVVETISKVMEMFETNNVVNIT